MPLPRWWRRLRGTGPAVPAPRARGVAASLRALLEDPAIPPALRTELAADFRQVETMLGRLEREEMHVAVFGRVSTGKSALANALLGREAFTVGVLHGTTVDADAQPLDSARQAGLVLIDTPGINELDGEARERLAFDVAELADLVIFVADGDLTRAERDALASLAATQRALLLVLNKADRYTAAECAQLLARLREHADGAVRGSDVLAVAARPAPESSIERDAAGRDWTREITVAPQVEALRERVLEIAGREGKALAAINAGVRAGQLADRVSERLVAARQDVATKLIRQYCLAKGIAVALNPVPVADLLAAAGLDAALVVQLARVYGLPLTRAESGRLVATISAQLVALMGAIWGVNLVASTLKGLSAGLSTALTATAQGALAWYATVLIGRAAQRYFMAGKSWGPAGAKRAVADVVADLDRDSILAEARAAILASLKRH